MNAWLFNFLYGFAHQNAFLDAAVNFCAEDLGYVVLLAMAFQILFGADTKAAFKKVFTALSSGFAAWLIAFGLKSSIVAPRPSLLLADIAPLFSEISPAFPSSHAAFFGGIAISLLFTKFPYRNMYAIAALIIGISRVMAGVHWPIDILNGFLIGFVSAWILSKIAKRYFNI